MSPPDWWNRRRFGLMIQANVATVPAWAPIGEYAGWYRAHLDADVRDVLLHASPLVETLAHHRDRWAHIESYDDFLPFLTFDQYDPDAWTALARDAGMGYAVMVAKHHDGLCWWDAPGTNRTVLVDGPKRNILGEFAAACERADLVFGTSYSLLDWADDRYVDCNYVESVVHPQVLDLVRRYGSHMLWGDGHWGRGAGHWRSNELMAAARAIDPDIVVNDRWWADTAEVRSYEYSMPATIVERPWEYRRGLGSGFGHNRADGPDHLLSPSGIVALLTEVVAKGGHLLLSVGPDASGTIPELYQDRLRAAGGWVRRHVDLIDRGVPWTRWGDDECRYLVVDDVVHVVDVSGRGRFAALDMGIGRVTSIDSADGPVSFQQDPSGTTLERPPRRRERLPVVYRLTIDAPPAPPIELFPPVPARPIGLADLLTDASPGSIIQLGEATYLGPAHVPEGVTVRGLGTGRTTIDGLESLAIVLGSGARLEHCTLRGGGDRIVWLPKPVIGMTGANATLLGCHIDGHVEIDGDGARVTSCTLTGMVARDVDEVDVSRSTFTGMHWDCAVDITGGSGHVVEGCEFNDVLQGIRLTSTIGAEVRGNQIDGRWWAIHLIDTEGSMVVGNSISGTMRAIDVDGGTLAQIIGNAVHDGDSGCVVQRGASDVEIIGNHWARCRIGLLAWDAGDLHHRENACVDLSEAPLVEGP